MNTPTKSQPREESESVNTPLTISAIWPRQPYDDEPASYEGLVYDAKGNVFCVVKTHSKEFTQQRMLSIVEPINSHALLLAQNNGLREKCEQLLKRMDMPEAEHENVATFARESCYVKDFRAALAGAGEDCK